VKYIYWTIFFLVTGIVQYFLLLLVSACLVNSKKLYDKHNGYYRWLLNSSTWILVFFGRIHYHTKGMEKLCPVVLQAHMDMVPQARAGKVHDFLKDPIETKIVDG
jgi:hypothetical protein